MLGLEPARDLLAGDHRAVHLAESHEADALARVGGGDLEAQRQPLFQELAQHRHQQGLPEVVADRDAQGRGRAPRQLGQAGEERLRLGPELQDAGQTGLARRGEPDAPARCRLRWRVCWLIGEEVRWCSRAAAPTEPLRATVSRLSRAGRRAASIISRSYGTGKKISLYLNGLPAGHSPDRPPAAAMEG